MIVIVQGFVVCDGCEEPMVRGTACVKVGKAYFHPACACGGECQPTRNYLGGGAR